MVVGDTEPRACQKFPATSQPTKHDLHVLEARLGKVRLEHSEDPPPPDDRHLPWSAGGTEQGDPRLPWTEELSPSRAHHLSRRSQGGPQKTLAGVRMHEKQQITNLTLLQLQLKSRGKWNLLYKNSLITCISITRLLLSGS